MYFDYTVNLFTEIFIPVAYAVIESEEVLWQTFGKDTVNIVKKESISEIPCA